MHAAARDDERSLRRLDPPHRLRQPRTIRSRPLDVVYALLEERLRVVECFRLHVLGQRERRRPAVGRIEQHRDRLRQRSEQLFGPRDAIPEPRDRSQAVVGRDGRVAKVFELLQHGIWLAARKGVARQQQDRQPVRVRERCCRHEVGRAGADGGRARHHPTAPVRLREGDCRVRHRLLVVRAKGGQ